MTQNRLDLFIFGIRSFGFGQVWTYMFLRSESQKRKKFYLPRYIIKPSSDIKQPFVDLLEVDPFPGVQVHETL